MKKLLLSLATVFAIIPVLALSAPDPLNKALQYVVSMQEENGAWSRLKGELPAETEPTSWAVKVLSMNGTEPQRVGKGVAFILKDQKADGSWNNNTAHTAFAILALTQAKKGGEAVKKGLDYLRSVRDKEGGFARIGREGAPLTIYTAVVLDAAKSAGLKKDDPMVTKAMAWLESCQNADGGYGMPKGSPSVAAGTGWVIRALRGFDVDASAPQVTNAVSWLMKTQKPSGGFSMVPPAPEDPEVTAYAIMGINRIPDTKKAIERAVDYLGKTQHSDGAYTSATPMQFNKVLKKNTQTTAFVAWALTEVK